MDMHDDFWVRVRCATFNHARYITDAMNGFAKQQTSFPFVCTIVDDASTDGAPAVIRAFMDKYFDMEDASTSSMKETEYGQVIFARHKTNKNCHFAVVLLHENHYSRKKSKDPYFAEWDKTRYLALCEGDDYWTDPLKLQKQIDYMEVHPECMLCFTNAVMRWEDNNGKPDKPFAPELEERNYEGPEMTEKWITPTASFLYRRCVIESDFYHHVDSLPVLNFVGDIPLLLTAKHFGTVHALADTTCVYRRQPNGFMLSADSNKKIKHGDYRYAIHQVFGKAYLESSVSRALYHYRLGLSYARKEHHWLNWLKLVGRIVYVYLRHPICAGKRILKIYQEKKERQSQG